MRAFLCIKMDIKIVVATHKNYEMPKDPMYLPLQVGAEDHLSLDGNFARDNTGDHISRKNPVYCELTGLYWAWKNLDCDAYGLVHYRRGLTTKSKGFIRKNGRFASVLSYDEADRLLCDFDMIVPSKRRYYIETLYDHYAHTLDAKHLDVAKDLIGEICPEYLPFVKKAYSKKWGYMFNMFVGKKAYADAYLKWLFEILFELEKRIPTQGYTPFQKRYIGRVSEILFNVWIEKQLVDGMKICEVPYLPMEDEHMAKKAVAFLKAKFFGKKYKESF